MVKHVKLVLLVTILMVLNNVLAHVHQNFIRIRLLILAIHVILHVVNAMVLIIIIVLAVLVHIYI